MRNSLVAHHNRRALRSYEMGPPIQLMRRTRMGGRFLNRLRGLRGVEAREGSLTVVAVVTPVHMVDRCLVGDSVLPM